MFGLDIAAFTAIEMAENGDSGHPNEIAFSSRNKAYDEDYSGDKSGISLYKSRSEIQIWSGVGTCGLYPANRPDSAGPALEFYAVPIRGGGRG